MGQQERVKIVEVEAHVHRAFKAFCALRDMKLKDAASLAINKWMQDQEQAQAS